MTRSTRLLALLYSFVLLASACGDSGRDRKGWLVHFSVTDSRDFDVAAAISELEAAAARDSRVEIEVQDHRGNVESQLYCLRDREKLGDVLVILPPEDGQLDAAIQKLHDAGHPVLVLWHDVGHDKFSAVMLRDDIAIGRAAGEWALQALPASGGNIIALKGNMSSSRSQDRQRGFLQALAANPTPGKGPGKGSTARLAKLVYSAETNGTQKSSQRAMREAMIAHSKIDLVFAHTDEIAYAAYESALASQRERELRIIGIGAHEDRGLSWLEEGAIDATVLNPTGASEAINFATRILSGEEIRAERVRLSSRIYTADTLSTGGSPVR